MSKIYIAGPFSKPRERKALKKMIEIVAKRYEYSSLYIPMEYKVPDDWQKLDGTWNLSNAEWARKVYENDIKELDMADMVFVLNTGLYRTAGTVWEAGYAKGKKIPVIAYIPEWAKKHDMSLMLMNSYDGYIDNDGFIYEFTKDILNQFNQK